jgi:hypothetical protein
LNEAHGTLAEVSPAETTLLEAGSGRTVKRTSMAASTVTLDGTILMSESQGGSSGPTAGGAGAGAGGRILIGRSFGKLGTVVPNPGLKLTGFTDHGINQATTRGVSQETISRTVGNPLIVLLQSGGQHLFLSWECGVALNPSGRVITTYPSSMFGVSVENLLKLIQ